MPHRSRIERAALALILAVGAWLRIQRWGAIEYNIDQAYPVWQALRTLERGALPLAGQGTSVLFANPPLTGYFYVPLLAVWRHPLMAYALTIGLNTLAVWLAYRALERLLGARAALIGAWLFAVNPWIVEDSRRTWVQALTPFFVALIFWALTPVLLGRTKHPRRRTLIALVGLALFAHTYLLAYALIAPLGVLIACYWRRVSKRALAVGALLFALLMGLYAVGLARQWDDTRARAQAFSQGQAQLRSEALEHALRLVTGGGYAAVRGLHAPQHDAALRQRLSDATHGVGVLLIGLGIGVALARLRRRSAERDAALILLIWWALPVLMMSYVSRAVHPFYLLLTVPAGHGLAAWGLMTLVGAASKRGQWAQRAAWGAAVLALGFAGTLNGLNAVRFAQNSHAHPSEDGAGVLPLAEATALGARLRAVTDAQTAIFAPMPSWTSATLAGRAVRAEETAGFDRALIVPRGQGVYVTFAPPGADPVPPLVGEPLGAPLTLRDGGRFSLWRATQDALPLAHPLDVPSDVDVRLLGWALHAPLSAGARVPLDLYFRVDALHTERGIWTFAPFAHLFDGTGARIAVVDGALLPPLSWRAGDVLVYRLELAVPAEAPAPVSVAVGFYDGVRGVNAIFRLPQGDAPADYTPSVLLEAEE